MRKGSRRCRAGGMRLRMRCVRVDFSAAWLNSSIPLASVFENDSSSSFISALTSSALSFISGKMSEKFAMTASTSL